MSEELKPCPFCGQKAQVAYNAENEPYGIFCARCKALVRWSNLPKWGKHETAGEYMAKIAERWNRRAEA